MGPNQTYIYFCTAKKTINERKKPPSDWEKIFAHDVTNKGLISKIYKQFRQLNNKTIKQKNHTTQSKRQKT